MADQELDATVVKLTQESLGKYVKKPPLTEKLLKKPPFRFLHDVFNVVIRETGCFAGLYTPDELNFENIKDREDKMRFLQKMIDVIKLATQTELTVRPSKIVAGHEAAKTNELLQLMAAVIEQQLDWQSAVAQVANGVDAVTVAPKPVERTNKDSKNQSDKVKEKPKEEKTKNVKAGNKTVTPTEKTKKLIERKDKQISPTEKQKKSSEGKDKQHSSSRMVKESSDKATRKAKPGANLAAKTTIEKKIPEPQKSPSPIKQERRASIEQHKPTPEPPPSQEAQAAIVTPPAAARERRNSKPRVDHQLEQPPSTATENEVVQEPSSRKSSAQHRSSATSSTKSRRTSGQKQLADEASKDFDSLTPTTSNLESSTTATEITKTQPPAVAEATSGASLTTTGKAPTKATTPLAEPSHQVDMKRETTFTRENSKDSNNSIGQRPRTSLRPPSARPASARPGAPRRRDRNVEIVLQPNDQIKMSGINVKLETFGDFDDDGENLVIIEDANALSIKGVDGTDADADQAKAIDLAAGDMSQQGHLVQQILETQKELVQPNSADGNKNEQHQNGMASGNRQSSARQMNGLRDVIQNLTKSVNPFGKLMDFIPEDIDAMQLELSMWRDSYTQAANELRRERSLTESATEPMKQQLLQIESSIKEYLEMNDASRTKILQNNEKILKMLMEQ